MRLNPTTAVLALALSVSLSTSGAVQAAATTGSIPAPTGISREKAEAMAQVGVVLQGDLPEAFQPGDQTGRATAAKEEAAFYECVGAPPPPSLVRNRGVSYVFAENRGTPAERANRIYSTADVAEVQDAAAADQKTMRTATAANCYREQVLRMIRRDLRSSPGTVTVELVPATVAGAEEAWAWQFTFTRTFEGQEITSRGFVVGARTGRALLTVTAMGGRELGELGAFLELAAQPVARVRAAACRPFEDLQAGNPAGLLDC